MAGLCHIANDILVFFCGGNNGQNRLVPFDGMAAADSRADNQLSEGDAGQRADGADLVCRSGLAELRGWNVKQRKKRPVLFWLLYTVIFLLMFYSVAQAQMQGYILNIQGWDSETMQVLRMVLVTIPLLVLNYFYTEMVYTAIDRLRLKKWELVLLNCRCFLAHESGAEKVAKQGYFLEGISNGVTYHFELTKRTYFMLRREKNLRLQIGTGILGGLYLTDLENPDFFKRVRRMDRKYAKRGIFLNILVMAFGVWLFWILK